MIRILLAITASFALATAWIPAQAQAINVNCPTDSLQDAVDGATDGDTIMVSGTCYERAIINVDNITLDGGQTAVIDGTGVPGSESLVLIGGTNVTIKGFTIQDSPFNGIKVRRSGSAIIQSNDVRRNAHHGIVVTQSSFALIGAGPDSHRLPPSSPSQGNTIRNNARHGIQIHSSSAGFIYHNLIRRNAASGVNVNRGGSARIDGNRIVGNDRGLNVRANSTVELSDNDDHGEVNRMNNTVDVRCRLGGSLDGNPPRIAGVFGPGVIVVDISASCPVATTLGF